MTMTQNLCGVACLKMAIDQLKGSSPSLEALTQEGLDLGAYDEEKGWIHEGLLTLAKRHGLNGKRKNIGQNVEFLEEKIHHSPVIISVARHYLNPQKAAGKKGGHLILISGASADGAWMIKDPYEPAVLEIQPQELMKTFSGNMIWFFDFAT